MQMMTTPNKATQNQQTTIQNADNSSSSSNLYLTFGLSETFEPTLLWAQKEQILNEILLMIDVCYCQNENRKIVPLLHFLKNESLYLILNNLPKDSDFSILKNISDALFRNDSILEKFYTQTNLSARQQFPGKLDEQYLLAMLYESNYQSDSDWYYILKAWALNHAIELFINNQNNQDQQLQTVAGKIRLASNDPSWHRLVLSLKPYTPNLEYLNQTLINKIKNISVTSTSHKQFITALGRVAKNENTPFDKASSQNFICNSSFLDIYKPINTDLLPVSFLPATEIENKSNFDKTGVIVSNDDDIQIVTIQTKELKPYWHQRLNAKSVLLAHGEQSQFLPYSWFYLNPHEADCFQQWLNELLQNPEAKKQFLGLCLWIAYKTGRSLAWGLEIRISDDIQDEWSLNIKEGILQKKPPQRQSGWNATPEQQTRVKPVVEKIFIPIPPASIKIIKNNHLFFTSAHILGDLWQPDWPTQQHCFTQYKPASLSRITSGMLGFAQGKQLYEKTHDSSFTKLLSSHPKSGLPAQCAYPGWDSESVQKNLNSDIPFQLQSGIALGSRLDPIEQLLTDEVQKATQILLISSKSQNLIHYHNLLTAYTVVSLLASTGARPVRDPFESPELFDFKNNFVYIDDKSTGNKQSGRLVPIPEELINFIQNQYSNHLKKLAQCLNKHNPQLSANIKLLSELTSAETLPFFFFLQETKLQWHSVSEASINSLHLFYWLLPLNLFRHRLSNQLRYKNIDPEIIDGVMGHAESQTASYSDYSLRSWIKDKESVMPSLGQIFEKLTFNFTDITNKNIYQPNHITFPQTSSTQQRVINFGFRARKEKRKLRTENAYNQAKLESREFLDNRSLSDLSEEEIDKLSRIMLFNKKGQPRSNGYLRYQYLINEIEQEFNNHKTQFKLKSYYQILSPENSLFNQYSVNAKEYHQNLKNELYSALKSFNLPSVSFNDASILATLLLLLESRITSKNLLEDILENKHFRLIESNKAFYLEYADNLNIADPYACTKRFQISEHCAYLLNKSLNKKSAFLTSQMSIPEKLDNFFQKANYDNNPNLLNTIFAIANRIEQANAIEMPGLICAYLSERVESYSLTWNDWLRFERNNPVEIPVYKEKTLSLQSEYYPNSIANLSSGMTDAYQSTIQLFSQIRDALNIAGNKNANHSISQNKRRTLSRDIENIIQFHSGKVGQSVMLAVQWLQQFILKRKKSSGERKFIKINTIQRYLSCIAIPFSRIGYNVDLLNLEKAEVTYFYTDLIESCQSEDVSYFCKRLINFHQFAKKMGVLDPLWSDIPLANTPTFVSPNLFNDKDYQSTLELIMSSEAIDGDLRNACAFLLIGCYRFFLRSGETIGLQQGDWVCSDKSNIPSIVIIQKNKWRDLKSKSARRQVPLLFSLSKLEHKIINTQWAQSTSTAGKNAENTLFSEQQIQQFNHLKRIVIACLRQITNNPKIVLHHARHCGAQKVFLSLFEAHNTTAWTNSFTGNNKEQQQIKETLLGTHQYSRRASRALALILGHAHPSTTFKNYIHSIDIYLKQCLPVENRRFFQKKPLFNKCKNLDEIPNAKTNIEFLLSDRILNYNPLSYSLVLKFFRLIVLGKSTENAGELLSIRQDKIQKIIQILEDVGADMLIKNNKTLPDSNSYHDFLHNIKSNTWNRLIESMSILAENNHRINKVNQYNFELSDIIGVRRQILLWKVEHWQFLADFIEEFSINQSDNLFDIVCKNNKNCNPLNLKCVKIEDYNIHKCFQFDKGYYHKRDKQFYSNRCAFCFNENKKHTIRNRYELILMLITFFVVTQ